MATVTLRSVPYGVSITVPKDKILQLYPDSMLARALEQDSTVDNIEITESTVSPNALLALQHILTNSTFPPAQSEYIQAANYFGIDSLGLLSRPKFVAQHPAEKLLTVDNVKTYSDLITFSMDQDEPYFAWYAMQKCPQELTKEIDPEFLERGIRTHSHELVTRLLKRGVSVNHEYPGRSLMDEIDGRSAHFWISIKFRTPLVIAIVHQNRAMINRFLNHPEIDLTAYNNAALQAAAYHGDAKTIDDLLIAKNIDGQLLVDPSFDQSITLFWAIESKSVDTVRRLLLDPRIDPNHYVIPRELLDQVREVLEQHPRYRPSDHGMMMDLGATGMSGPGIGIMGSTGPTGFMGPTGMSGPGAPAPIGNMWATGSSGVQYMW